MSTRNVLWTVLGIQLYKTCRSRLYTTGENGGNGAGKGGLGGLDGGVVGAGGGRCAEGVV